METEKRMTQTETLLTQATEIAKRTFIDPSELAVMKIFDRLAYELDCSAPDMGSGHATVH